MKPSKCKNQLNYIFQYYRKSYKATSTIHSGCEFFQVAATIKDHCFIDGAFDSIQEKENMPDLLWHYHNLIGRKKSRYPDLLWHYHNLIGRKKSRYYENCKIPSQ